MSNKLSTRKPTNPKSAASKAIKLLWKKSGKHEPLKRFAKLESTPAVMEVKNTWLFNKKANPSKPPQGIGSTRRKKNSTGGKSPKPVAKTA